MELYSSFMPVCQVWKRMATCICMAECLHCSPKTTKTLLIIYQFSQFSSVTQSCPTLCDPMNRSTPGLPVHHQLPEFTQTHAHRVSDAIQPSHPLSSPSPPAPNPSQHQGLFQWVNSSHEVDKVLKFQLQHQSFQWTPRADLLLYPNTKQKDWCLGGKKEAEFVGSHLFPEIKATLHH